MKFWLMSLAEGPLSSPLGSVMPDTEFSKAASLCGSTPAAVRKVFRAANANTVEMQLSKAGSPTVEREHQVIPDLLFWVSTPIFSERAASLAIEFGCDSEEFWPCRFDTNQEEKFFFHLPLRSFDIIDYEKSSFSMTIPSTPPLPMFIQAITIKEVVGFIAPCFRASIPGREQVLTELFVLDNFKSAWELRGFSGAAFRLLSD
jgi:hypothetical protein